MTIFMTMLATLLVIIGLGLVLRGMQAVLVGNLKELGAGLLGGLIGLIFVVAGSFWIITQAGS